MKRFRVCLGSLMVVLAVLFVTHINATATGDIADTMEKLEELYLPSEKCGTCHTEIYNQWQKSVHRESILHSLDGLNSFIVNAIEKDPARKARDVKAELLKCLGCHAPMLESASPQLINNVITDIKLASSKATTNKDEKKRAKERLSRLNVSCYVCHNAKAVPPPDKPEKNTVYGSTGKDNTPYHKSRQTTFLDNAIFCMQCHGTYTAPDREQIICSTIAQSYRDQYASAGGQNRCQDCHMVKNNRGHTFPGAYVLETLKEALTLSISARAIKDQPAAGERKWIPSAAITVDITNNAGHRLPDGCMWSSKIVLDITAINEKDKVVWSETKEFFEAGLDINGNRRYDPWEVKDILDLSLQPRKMTSEIYYPHFPEDTKQIKLQVRLRYIHTEGLEFLVHEERKVLRYQ
ncbi:cytochrome c [Candidatus Magnetobacterium bavaricum]|uniref:Cytochrome c n=1 Tax=Candidatus Magnetobacterium bavaricum TaxID=29290 RepID=A0A0F3H009_9BACT|nr:cytochrome c [Candidatus Magnetobacterium bavaricum]